MKAFFRTLLAATLLSASLAQAVEVGGINFAPQTQVAGDPLALNGAGLRTRLTFKVYAMGLYLRSPSSSSAEILQDNGEKRIRIVMIRDLDGKQFADAMLDGLKRNHDDETLAALKPSIDALLAAVQGSGEAKAGTEVILDRLANGATRLQINGQPQGSDISDPAFYPALLRIWLGERPADSGLKASLLKAAQ
ncbi:chalcone isomerase family protein [Thauera sp.]|uniref:chalcone isomerase family protein n=1 Tax=Thauera sp. TaxID=1905334 RepID=UPI0039E4C368